jgi:hypothetical protein
LKSAISSLGPDLTETGENVRDLTDTVKRQPWRLVWPTTKKYPEDEQRQQRATDTITVRKATKGERAAATPAPRRSRERDVVYPGG